MDNAAISISGGDRESTEALVGGIMQILESGAEQETLRAALGVLERGVVVREVTISNVSVSMPISNEHYHYSEEGTAPADEFEDEESVERWTRENNGEFDDPNPVFI